MYVNLGYCHINIIYNLESIEVGCTKKPVQSITMTVRDVFRFHPHRSFKYNKNPINIGHEPKTTHKETVV